MFQSVLHVATKLAPKDEKVYFIFDRQDEFADRARRLYNEAKSLQGEFADKMAEDIVFSSKNSAILLQAADFIAYLSRWYAEEGERMTPIAFECFNKLAEPSDSEIKTITPESIDVVLSRCPFRTTFFEGMIKPDVLEQVRMTGNNVLAYKIVDTYFTHHIRPENVRVIGRLDQKDDGTVQFVAEKQRDENQID